MIHRAAGGAIDAAAHTRLGSEVAWLVGFVSRVEFCHVGAVWEVACCCSGRGKKSKRKDDRKKHRVVKTLVGPRASLLRN